MIAVDLAAVAAVLGAAAVTVHVSGAAAAPE